MRRSLMLFLGLMTVLLALAVPSLMADPSDRWAVMDRTNHTIWHVTRAGTLEGTAYSAGFNPQKLNTQSVAKSTTLTATSPYVTFVTNMTAGIYLPDATTCAGKPVWLKADTATTGNISVYGNGSQTIDGASPVNITTRGKLQVISNGTNWAVITN